MSNGRLFVISGPSGAGKGTLVERVCSRFDNVWTSVSATSRAPRSNDVPGVTYTFYSREQFEQLIAEDGFLEWAQYGENYYGTPRAAAEEHLANGDIVILEIEVQGAMQIKEKMPDACMVFIEPPSLEVLEQRLRGRGTDTEEAIAKRLEIARVELSQKMRYDMQLVNDDLDIATETLIAFIEEQTREPRG